MSLARRLAVTVRKPLYVAYYGFLFGRRFPGRAALDRFVRRFEEDTHRGDIPLSRDEWESEYREGRWSYLASADEAPRYTRLVELLTRLVPDSAVLDVGCGEGLLRDRLGPHGYRRFVGVDLSEEAVRTARARGDERAEFVVAPGETYTPRERFDAVVFNECLYYFDDPVAVVERYRGFVDDGGVILVSMFRALRSSAIQRLLRAALPVLDETAVSSARGTWMVTAFAADGARTSARPAASAATA